MEGSQDESARDGVEIDIQIVCVLKVICPL